MSPRYAGTDEQGRPIVAELGRAETPTEIADRRAASSRAHRSNQTLINLLLAIGASLVVVVVLVLVVVRPAPSGDVHRVDYRATASQAEQTVSATLAAPPLPKGWYANRAELDQPGDAGITTWGVGLVTPDSHYVGIAQGIKADATWTADQIGKLPVAGTKSYGGLNWQVYDGRGIQNDAGGGDASADYALVATSGDSTIVLSGTTATDAEFATVATAIGGQLS